MEQPDIADILRVMEAKNYVVFRSRDGHNLNLVGIRTSSVEGNRFDDWITCFYDFYGTWNFFAFPGTTDPSTYYRENPENVRGTAVMKPGQYRGAYMLGKHRNYKALQQKSPITVFRDANRDLVLDTTGMVEETGIFGTNLHRADAYRASLEVGKWSAGCQVMQDPDHFAFLLMLCERGAARYGNSFTYTLLTEEDF